MGAFGESIAAYAQPLLDKTDGSSEQMNRAFEISLVCWNLALMPEEECEEAIREMQPSMKMDDGKFEDFRRALIDPMIRRHKEMFPNMPGLCSMRASPEVSAPPPSRTPLVSKEEKYPGTGRNEPCPCNSGKKYKKCCGR